MQTRENSNGLTRLEVAVTILIVGVLALSIKPEAPSCLLHGTLTQTLNNQRQLYIAAFSMATDYGTEKNPQLGWPGDLALRKENPVLTVSQYINRLVAYEYLKKEDMAKVLHAPGITPWDTVKELNADRNCPFKIYRTRDEDGPAVLFCATRNFTYNQDLDAKRTPYGSKSFVVFRKGGDGAVFNNKKMARPTNLSTLGLLPGRTDYATRNVETSEDSLLPR